MSQEIKEVALTVFLILLAVISIVSTFWIFIYVDDIAEFEHQLKCKEVGGVYVYENNNWICK